MQKMGSVCNHHLLSPSSSKKMSHLQDILINNIPPRKLISRTSSTSSDDSATSPAAYDPDSDPYSSDQFRMFEFKIRRCTRSRSHDWTDCPFAHPGEKARRRDPRKFHYSGAVCPEFRRSGACSGGDDCEFAHGVFEVWLHPSRYRTEACKDGKNCKRKVCFFAHSPRELRLLPSDSPDLGDVMLMKSPPHCCKHCNCSPRSTLNAPMSPAWGSAYEDAIGEIMSSLEAMNFKEANSQGGLWVDVPGVGDDQQFLLSPSTPVSHHVASRGYNGNFSGGGYGAFDSPGSSRSGYSLDSPMGGYNSNIQVEEMQSKGGMGDPDLGWVNDLLM